MTTLTINGKTHEVDAPDDMPLLWVLRDLVGLTGTKFGCGIAQCGACTVHLDGAAVRSGVLPVASVVGKKITTIEAVGETPAGRKVQAAWTALDRNPERPGPVDQKHNRCAASASDKTNGKCKARTSSLC